jgi:hypothetical protein
VECKNVTILFISQFLFPLCFYATELAAKVHLSCVHLTDGRSLLVEMKVGKMSIMLCMLHAGGQFPSV